MSAAEGPVLAMAGGGTAARAGRILAAGCWRRWWGLVGGLLLACACLAGEPPPQDILLLYSYGQNLPAQARITAGLNQVIRASRLVNQSFHHEYLDIAPPRSPRQRQALADLLTDKYRGVRFALIITVFDPARDFLVQEGRNLSPGAPTLALFGQETGVPLPEGREAFKLPLHFDLGNTLAQALRLFPRTRQVLFVCGSSEANRRVEAQARREFAPWGGRLSFHYSSDQPVATTLAQASHLPADSIIVFSIVSSDVTGKLFVPTDVVRQTVAVANAPTFGILSTYLGEGVVGGAMVDPETAGVMVGEMVVALQKGQRPAVPALSGYLRPMYDWNQLRRWHGDPDRLPADRILINHPVTLWGQYRNWVLAALAVVLLLSGLSLALLLANRRKTLAERALRESERFLREAQEAGGIGAFVWDLASDRLWMSPVLMAIQGQDGCPWPTWQAWLASLDPETRSQVVAESERVQAGQARFDRVFPIHRRKDGELRWVHGCAQLERRSDGQAWRMLGTLQDISERRWAESATLAIHTIAEAAQEATDLPELFARTHGFLCQILPVNNFSVALWDPAGTRLELAYAADELGPGGQAWPLGAGLLDWVVSTARPFVLSRQRDEPALGDGRIHLSEPEPSDWLGLPLSDQGRVLGALAVHSYAVPFRYSEGELEFLRFVASQVTAGIRRHQVDAERRQLQEELEHTQRLESLGSLASGIAHDMNNILASIQAVAQTLQLGGGAEATASLPLTTIERACVRGRDLVKGLTHFARKGLRETQILDMNELVHEQGLLLQRTWLQRVQIVEDLSPDLPAIRGESSTLGSAIMNLCVNAGDAMADGGTLTLRTCRWQDTWVQVEVTDTGFGMPPEVVRRAMEPFFTTKPFGKGTGLGLAMVFNTVKAHGGTVQILSKVGSGTTLVLRLPALGGHDPAVPAPDPAQPALAPLRMLLIDDDPLIRAAIPALLRMAGHQVEAVESGGESLARLEAGLAVDLVVLDLNMPVMGGMETLRRIRELRPTLPTVLATGFLDERNEAVLRTLPSTATLIKPYTLDQFFSKVRGLGFT